MAAGSYAFLRSSHHLERLLDRVPIGFMTTGFSMSSENARATLYLLLIGCQTEIDTHAGSSLLRIAIMRRSA